MPNKTIYIADALAEKMKAFDLKWSAIASQAFETAIKLERVKSVDTSDASIERLRASRDKDDERRKAEGIASGKNWALHKAEYSDIERVVNIDFEQIDAAESNADAAYLLAAAMLDEERPSVSDAIEQMEYFLGRKSPTIAEVRGFIEGVWDVYSQVD
jgi:hypothetical protein